MALCCLRANLRVARKGWNGKGMFLVLVPGSEGLTVDEGRPLAKAGVPVGTKFNYLPHIDMFTAQGDFVPWLASQTDLLAHDWDTVKDGEEIAPTHSDDAPKAHWTIHGNSLSIDDHLAGVVDLHSGDKITDGTITETVGIFFFGPALDSPAIVSQPHPDGSPGLIISAEEFVAGGWKKIEAEK